MTDHSKTIDKIKKLLSLANSSNPNEAFLAAKRARNLMDKNGITKADIENAKGSEFFESVAIHKYKQQNTWVMQLHGVVGSLNDCVSVITFNSGISLKYRGFTADAVVAQMTLDYLIDACESNCKKSDVKGRSEKNQFRLGFTRSIIEKITVILDEREKEMVLSTATSLIELKIEQIVKYFGELKPLKAITTREPTEEEVYAHALGIQAGKETGLDKQINKEDL